jgi:hypothetical protein
MPCGEFRCVFLVGRFALKLPRLSNLRAGMQCNRWEREMWLVWRPKFQWANLCPIAFADPFGFVVLMPRASQPVSRERVEAEDHDYYPMVNAECKPEDYGLLNGRTVIVDYGLPYADMVTEERITYQSHQGPALRLDDAAK